MISSLIFINQSGGFAMAATPLAWAALPLGAATRCCFCNICYMLFTSGFAARLTRQNESILCYYCASF